MLTMDSKVNQQIARNLELAGMDVSREQQELILKVINSNKEITIELISDIALKG